MFKKIDDLGNIAQVNKSSLKSVRNRLLKASDMMADIIDDILPKKTALMNCRAKVGDARFEMLSINNEVMFVVKEKDNYVIPHLKILHKYPDMLPKFQIDKGGIKFVFNGANVMAPGLTSPGGKMDDVDKNSVVAIYCEGKTHAVAIGVTLLSTQEIRSQNKGIAVEIYHHLNDALWHMTEVKKK